jgi:exonuclease VII small subunit
MKNMRIKSRVLILSLALSFLITSVPAQAETNVSVSASASVTASTSSTTPKGPRGEIKNKIEDVRSSVQTKREEVRTTLLARLGERLKKHIDQMIRKFNAAVERLEKLTQRIESRIAKLKAEGQNTTEAEGLVAQAKVQISLAKTDIANLPGAIESALSTTAPSTTPKILLREAQSLVEKIRKELTEAHSLLVKAITKIKGLRVGDAKVNAGGSVNATTSTSTE